MALGTKQVALSTTAAKVADASAHASTVKVKNMHATILVYVGDLGVTASTGYLVNAAGGEVTFEYLGASEALYAVAASGTPSVCVARVAKSGA